MLKILFLLILGAEVFLSHQDGYKSGDESKRLASVLKLPDRVIYTIGDLLDLFPGVPAKE